MMTMQTTNPPVMQIQPAVGITSKFLARHIIYKLSMACLGLFIVLFIVGFSVPDWIKIMNINGQGLWVSCNELYCLSTIIDGKPAWLDAVRALECLALIAYIICLPIEGYQDFYKTNISENNVLEITAIIGGVCSIIGVIIYGVKMPELFSLLGFPHYLDWGFGLTTASSSVIIICAGLIAYSRSLNTPHINNGMIMITPGNMIHPSMNQPGLVTQVAANKGSTTLAPAGNQAS